MAKVTLTTITSGYASVAALNANFSAITAAIENTVSRDGTTPNSMSSAFDMNSYDILNAGTVSCTSLEVGGTDLATQVTLAETAATEAAASAAAALVSETNAGVSETNAASSASLIADWGFEGAWLTATNYYVNNIVTYDGETYIALLDHTSGVFATDYGALKWAKLAAKGAPGAGTGDLLAANNLSDVANTATALANLGGQPVDTELTALAGVTSAADALPYFTGSGTATTTTLTSAARTVLDDATVGAMRTTLGAAADATTQTIYIPAAAMVPRTTNGAASGLAETTTNKVMIKTLDFDTATDEHAQFSIRMPKGWDEGTITFVPSWSHAATATNFGVAWFLQGVAVSNDDTLDVAFGTAQSSVDTGGTTNDLYIGPVSSAITIAGTPAAEDMVIFQIYRDVSDAGDTMAIDARLHGVTIYYTTTSLDDA